MGHVFVLHGDLMALACDAWLVPSGYGPGNTWVHALERGEPRALPEGWGSAEGPRCIPVKPASRARPPPQPFLTYVVGDSAQGPQWFVDGARAFVETAAPAVKKRPPLYGRSKHLLALPVVGTGGGGGMRISGSVLRLLLSTLREEAARHDVDIALVVRGGPAFAAAQKERLNTEGAFNELTAFEIKKAERLAKKALRGDLVLFLGAGVSQAAGLPGWNGLLQSFAQHHAGIDDEAALADLGELDRAAIIAHRIGDTASLGQAVAQDLIDRASHYALGHGLLAGLPVDEVITTNYDTLFEWASVEAERPVTVLPGGHAERGQRWMLKMHGCVSRPESIVLTREDYLRFQENRTALAGIVQALLITRHMLFVGFSFTDDNFHRIAHAVRQAVQSAEAPRRFGTTLVVRPNSLARELWRDDVEWIAFDEDGALRRGMAEQARRLEIFLDRLGAAAATRVTHLCDRRYDAVLSVSERRLRDRLEAIAHDATDEERKTAAWAEVTRMLDRLGWRPEGLEP
jgi:hypothetical protein